MSRIVLPLKHEEHEDLARLSAQTGLPVGVLMILRQKDYCLVPRETPQHALMHHVCTR